MGKTKNGVYYDLRETEYFSVMDFTGAKVIFYFSSKLNQEKFDSRFIDDIAYVMDLILNKFGVDSLNDTLRFLGVLRCYQKIEKRGFRVSIGGEDFWHVRDITLAGL